MWNLLKMDCKNFRYSPIKLFALGEHRRSSYGLRRVHKNLKRKLQTVLEINLLEDKTDLEKK